jgi:hypothetical protein
MSKIITSHGWNNNLHLANDRIELVITLDVGPRILRLAHIGGPNVFKEYPDQLGKSGESEWMIRGGHRLWVAPEADYSYALDNQVVSWEELGSNHIKIHSSTTLNPGWEKEIEVQLHSDKDEVTVKHRLQATKDLDFPIAPWALSVMAPGGTAIIPQPPRGSHPADLLPNRKLILWPYTDLQDTRYKWNEPNILVQQRPDAGPTKFGLLHQAGWIGYQLGDTLFAKTISFTKDVLYPDMGVNFELFSNEDMLELESLAPLIQLKKGQSVEHMETWILQKLSGIDWDKTSLLDLLDTSARS